VAKPPDRLADTDICSAGSPARGGGSRRSWLYLGMKTDISLPVPLFHAGDVLAE
jgi:hypothetical protein